MTGSLPVLQPSRLSDVDPSVSAAIYYVTSLYHKVGLCGLTGHCSP
jgi:hypothetical protein